MSHRSGLDGLLHRRLVKYHEDVNMGYPLVSRPGRRRVRLEDTRSTLTRQQSDNEFSYSIWKAILKSHRCYFLCAQVYTFMLPSQLLKGPECHVSIAGIKADDNEIGPN